MSCYELKVPDETVPFIPNIISIQYGTENSAGINEGQR